MPALSCPLLALVSASLVRIICIALQMALMLSFAGCGLSTPFGETQSGGRASEAVTWQDFSFKQPGMIIKGQGAGFADNGQDPLWVIIEGDGAGWGEDGSPPSDPTPRRAIGKEIARRIAQSRPVLYLARPCQFLAPTGSDALRSCHQVYWAEKRFDGAVIKAYQSILHSVAQERSGPQRRVILVGYSGGGVIAAELATHLPSLVGLVTIASPLDLPRWTAHHKVSPLASPTPTGALLDGLAHLHAPSLYLFGQKDRIVPPSVLDRVIARLKTATFVKDAGHNADWATLLHERIADWPKE